MAYLTVIKGPDQGRKFLLTEPAPAIGRDARNSVRLHDSEISRIHAELRLSRQGYVVYDLNSSNGTFVNGTRIESVLLRSGDKIQVGGTELLFHAAPAEPVSDLASRIDVSPSPDDGDASAIIRSIKHSEGTEYLRHPERAQSQWLRSALANLETMYETSQAISRIRNVDELLDHILELVFGSIGADRGCIVLRDGESGELHPVSVRYAQGLDSNERITLSRTITDWVLSREEGVIILDASRDQRFSAAQSVTRLGIREAICVPLRGRHETFGVIYVDTKTDSREVLKTQKPVTFTDDHLKLMIAIAHQAGLAIEDSRFYQAMLQAERLAAIGQTIATLSHHIKNILQGLRSGSYLIEMGLSDKNLDLLEKGWTTVQKNQDKIYHLVMDMLSYSKEREPSLAPTDVNELVAEVLELMADRARELGIVMNTRLDETIPRVLLDPEGMHRVLLNIVTNALEAVEGRAEAQVEIATTWDDAEGHVRWIVSDNGVGISPEEQGHIFQVFHSTKGAKGSGLGLAVSRKIVQEHGGEITVESQVGKGSCFTIEVPIRPAPDSDPTTTPSEAASAADPES